MTEIEQTRALIRHAQVRLSHVLLMDDRRAAWDEAHEAADALHAAGRLAPDPHCVDLFRVRGRLIEALRGGGRPAQVEIEAISRRLDDLLDDMSLKGGSHAKELA